MKQEKDSLARWILAQKEIGAVLPLCLLLLCVLIVNPAFFSSGNIFDVLRTTAFAFFLAVPVTFLMAAGGMDLSIGAVVSIGGVIVGTAMRAGLPIFVSILLALLGGAAVGFVNGISIVKFRLPAFIITLATQYCVNGINSVWTNGKSITNLPAQFKVLGQYRLFGAVPIPILYALVFGVVGYIVLNKTKAGRSVLAVGGNASSAYLAGINVTATQISIYVLTAAIAALTGVIYAARFGAVQTSIGSGIELTTIAAVIIGGTSMAGGVATMVGSLLGCILISTISNALVLMGVSVYWQNFIFGLILIAALYIDRYRQKIINS